jgi:phenylacetate-CoA ligase
VQRSSFSADEPYGALVAKLNAFQPHIAFSYGSYAEHFARYLVETGQRPALPRVWRYSGDLVTPGGKEMIERRFGCTVNSTYSSVETGPIGFQCELCQGFHLDIDLTAIRIVDDAGQDVAVGEDGEIVVSNLHNRAMVLLNYRIGDWGALATEPCPCGRTLPLLEQLQGRRGEMIELADGRVLPSLLVGSLFTIELESALKSQIVHPAPGHIHWRIVPFAGVDRDELRRTLLDRGRESLGVGTRVDVEFVADIPPTRGGKFRQVVRHTDSSSGAEAER